MLGGDDEVGRQRQLESAARGDPVDRGDNRFRAPVQFGQAREPSTAVIGVDRLAGGRGLQIPAGAEEAVAGPVTIPARKLASASRLANAS